MANFLERTDFGLQAQIRLYCSPRVSPEFECHSMIQIASQEFYDTVGAYLQNCPASYLTPSAGDCALMAGDRGAGVGNDLEMNEWWI